MTEAVFLRASTSRLFDILVLMSVFVVVDLLSPSSTSVNLHLQVSTFIYIFLHNVLQKASFLFSREQYANLIFQNSYANTC